MQFRLNVIEQSSDEWVAAVMNDFDAFLQDHANCERKASAMAMSFVAKYPDRKEILQELIDTGIEELEHFKQVYEIMEARGVSLPHEIGQDNYVKELLGFCRSGREERFLDRLLLASVVESRGAERFKRIYEALEEGELKSFYQQLWASEARHGETFIKLALIYFDEDEVFKRVNEMNEFESKVILKLPIKPALH